MLRHLVRYAMLALVAQSAVLPAIVDPQADFAPGVPRGGTPGVRPPEIIKQVDPTYSNDAMRAGVQGRTIIDAVIGSDGTIERSQVRCSVHPSLDAQALKALSTWAFKPALLNGVPTPFVVEVQMEFRLHREGEPPARTVPCTPPK